MEGKKGVYATSIPFRKRFLKNEKTAKNRTATKHQPYSKGLQSDLS